jgi:hypothetical protein
VAFKTITFRPSYIFLLFFGDVLEIAGEIYSAINTRPRAEGSGSWNPLVQSTTLSKHLQYAVQHCRGYSAIHEF